VSGEIVEWWCGVESSVDEIVVLVLVVFGPMLAWKTIPKNIQKDKTVCDGG